MQQISSDDVQQHTIELTSYSVAWFWGRLNAKELVMKPPFQRNPVWQTEQKAYLIDSILRGYPVPELYLQTSVGASGVEIHTIVDGQQRIRACLEYISDKFGLGDESGDFAGLTFSQLEEPERQRIFGYKFVIRVLPEMSDERIREIFGRLNRNNVALNRQELRNATYWGEFITTMKRLAEAPFWATANIFTPNDFRRMLDVEYISELSIATLFGPQNKKARLDRYYAAFEQEFPDRERLEMIFARVLGELEQLMSWPSKLRWSRKVDFYTLFSILADRADELPFDRTERNLVSQRLEEFSAAVNQIVSLKTDAAPGNDKTARFATAYARGIRNSSDLGSRIVRKAVLDAYLRGDELGSVKQERIDEEDPLSSLPQNEELLEVSEDETDDDPESPR